MTTNVLHWLDRYSFTSRNVLVPTTFVIERMVWDEHASEALLYFVGETRSFSMRDDGRDWLALQGITGERNFDRMVGRTVRVYPVNYPEPDLELF